MNDRPKILSIDDNDNNQKLIEEALTTNYEVETAMSGGTGIEILSRLKPDAILLDVDMPHVDGLRLSRMIRAEPSFNNVPILFVSELDGGQDKAQGYQAGGDGYITKPLNLEQLKQTLDQSLRHAQAKSETISASNDYPALDQAVQKVLDATVELISLETVEEVGQHALQALDALGLKGAVYLHESGQTFSTIGPLSDLESLLLQQAKCPYPAEFSARYLWGSANLGAIIQNMPHVDYDTYQPLVQLISSLLNGADQKLQALQPRPYKIKARSSHPVFADQFDFNSLHIHRYKLEHALETLEHRSEQQLSHLCHQLQALAGASSMGVTDAQKLRGLADEGLRVRLAIYDQCLEIQAHFSQINQLIERTEPNAEAN